MKKYASVVFLQDSEADEPLDILNNEGREAAINYLSQWDYGEYYDIREESGKGSNDRSLEHNGYLLSYNTGIGYIGLEKIISS